MAQFVQISESRKRHLAGSPPSAMQRVMTKLHTNRKHVRDKWVSLTKTAQDIQAYRAEMKLQDDLEAHLARVTLPVACVEYMDLLVSGEYR